ncbi:hypothetical protein [Pseudomonas putida]|uniref:hypothetical protein n=1 Tax=Pseudomonas putida TaxID=303 RepID=UPI000CD40872|nr:hypothetical protein [Pseudomonas putida]POF86276.1 hypothetical protein BGP81_28325 [Pseudomonas putida]
MSSSQQMICVPREWLSAYLENDNAMVCVDGERTSLWELLSNATHAVQPDEQPNRSVAEHDERAAFEAHYAAEFSKVRSPEHPVTAEDVKGMRDGDGYGDRYYLNGQWVGWKARAALDQGVPD